jgi:regulator of sirC expression with transglutaminase-like and TPR domain
MTLEPLYQAFIETIQHPDPDINLAKAALQIACFEYPHLKVDNYLNRINLMADEVKKRLPDRLYPLKIVKIINQYLFEDLQFTGNTQDYYDPRNSYLNDVIERRTGIPLTLSIIYLEIAKQIDFPMVGIGMPGHFIIRPDFEEVEIFVDPFHGGEILFEQDCQERLSQVYQQPVKLEEHFLNIATNQQILLRLLTNLKYIYLNRQQWSQTIRTLDLLLLLIPNHPLELRDRGLVYYQIGQFTQAKQDLGFYLALLPNAQDAESIRQLLQKINS